MVRHPTISDVARLAGVGVGSVSRVINQASSVSPAMAARVHRVMADLGYVPPDPRHRPGPRHRTTERRPVVELVNVFRLGLGWMPDAAPVYARVLDGIDAAAAAAGLELRVRQSASWPGDGDDGIDGPPSGRLFFGTMEGDVPPPPGMARQAAVWIMGPPPLGFLGDSVQVDHFQVGLLAARHLLAQGHRHAAYLGCALGDPGYLVGYRGNAFRYHLTRHGGTVHLLLDPALVTLARKTHSVDRQRLERLCAGWRRLRPRPTALFLQSDMFAQAVHQFLRQSGLLPEREVAIITCDNEPQHLRRLSPPPAVIDIRTAVIGATAIEALLRRRLDPSRPPTRILVQPQMA